MDDAHRRGEEKKEEDQQDKPDIAPEDNAIEMSDDIEGKEHDREPQGDYCTILFLGKLC